MATTHKSSTGLILSGGGARAAYQVGVLRALADILPDSCANPFDIICGTSAGGLNASLLATHADCLQSGVAQLENVWNNFQSNQVYRTDWPGVLRRAARFLWTMAAGRLRPDLPISLLDNSPLPSLLKQKIHFQKIQHAINKGYLRALCITASGYSSGESVSFFQGEPSIENWKRSRRIGIRSNITLEHLMASAAIPILFPAVRVNREFFGDGALRQLSPISPALHLGAERVLIIGVSGQPRHNLRQKILSYPSIAQVSAHILNSSFVDSLEADVERLTRINKTLDLIPEKIRKQHSTLRHIDTLVLSPPAEALDQIAMRHSQLLPKSIRLFVRGSGATHHSGAGILSYLLFEAAYCKDLMALGYEDAMKQRDALISFLGVNPATCKKKSAAKNAADVQSEMLAVTVPG